MNRLDICKNIIQSIKDYITNPDNLNTHREKNHFIRKRKLSMLHVILYLLYSSKASMFQNLISIRDNLADIDFPSISKQAISKARQFIKPDLFKELFYLSTDLFYSNLKERKLWHGYHIYAVDGSNIELPNSKSNFAYFGEMFAYPNTDRKYTQALASIIYDVLDDYIIHASIHKFCASERSSAREHIENIEAMNIYDDSIIIFDRGYYSEKFFRHCVEQNHLCLMRLKESFKISKKCNGDIITTIAGNPEEGSEDIKIRVIEVTLDDGSKEYLGTNIFDENMTADTFRELYFLRWPIELKYRELKSRLSLEEFNGATPTAIRQEFFINLLLSNLSSLIKNQVDEKIDKDINSKPNNKHRYQANRSVIIGRVKALVPKILCSTVNIDVLDTLFEDAFKCRSQIIPGRKFTRKNFSKRGRTHFRNHKVAF